MIGFAWLDRLSIKSIAIRLFLTCWLIYGAHFATNTVREIYPAISLAEKFSFDVSEYVGLHPDIFEPPGGGAYINNNPGASILGSIPYFVAKPIIQRIVNYFQVSRATSGQRAPQYESEYPLAREFYKMAYERGLDVKFGLAAGVMQLFLMAPLSAFSVVVMFFVMYSLTNARRKALFLALLFAFATPIFYRTAQLNHNLLQAHFTFFSFLLLWRPWSKMRLLDWRFSLLAGALAGWTIVLDYSGLVLVAALAIYVVLFLLDLPKTEKRTQFLVAFISGVVISLLVLWGYQWIAFGNPLLPAQHYMPATRYSELGYQGMDWPKIDLLLENTFGFRYGLFLSAPLFLLLFYLPGWYNPRIRLIGRKETLFVVILTLGLLLFTAANQYSRMQFNSGIRHLVPVVPFLFLIVSGVILHLPRRYSIPIGLFAIFWSWCLAMYRDVEQGLGVIESFLHVLQQGVILPWMSTLEQLNLLPRWLSPGLVLLTLVAIILLIWWLPPQRDRPPAVQAAL